MYLDLSLSVIGTQQADMEEMKLMASTPYRSHIFNVANFNLMKSVQKELITQVCAGVDDQLHSLVSGEEGEMWLTVLFKWHLPVLHCLCSTNGRTLSSLMVPLLLGEYIL